MCVRARACVREHLICLSGHVFFLSLRVVSACSRIFCVVHVCVCVCARFSERSQDMASGLLGVLGTIF